MIRRMFPLPVAVFLVVFAFASPPAVHAQEPAGKRVALLVGVNKYEKRGLGDLTYAERDVEELAGLLRGAGYKVELLTGSGQGDRRATLANIEQAIQRTLKGLGKRDLVLVALAGHGLQIEVPGADGKLRAESFYCPCDAQKSDPATLLSIGRLFESIDERGGGQNVLLVDACREDPTRGRGLDGARVSDLPEGMAVLFGCRSGQKTYEDPDAGGGHGIFFHFVLEGLRGGAVNERGEVTWGRLAEYVVENVETQTPVLVDDPNVVQTPNLVANLPGRSPVLVPPDRRPAPKPLSAPFNATAAKAAQEAWAGHLRRKVTEKNSLGMILVLVPPGKFTMGSSQAERKAVTADDPTFNAEHMTDEDQVKVTLTQPFWLAQTEVTVGQFRAFVEATNHETEAEKDGEGGYGYNATEKKFEGRDPKFTWRNTGLPQSDDHPVVNITWNDAEAFCEWLSRNEGVEYRLPREAEWEWSCRAGTTTRYSCGDTITSLRGHANVADQSLKRVPGLSQDFAYATFDDGFGFSSPVRSFKANPFGLYEMHGNAWEWCSDWYNAKLPGGTNPEVAAAAEYRVYRGGDWCNLPARCRSAFRDRDVPSYRGGSLGLRPLRVQSR